MNITAQRPSRALCVAAALVACGFVVTPGCKRPVVGEPTKQAATVAGPAIALTGASVDTTGRLNVTFTLSDGGAPVSTADAARALSPRFTLAALSTHPVDGLAAWKSLLLTGSILPSLPLDPPGGSASPTAPLVDTRQPGADAGGTISGGDGEFSYAFGATLPAGFDPRETLRVGVWLLDNRTAAGTSTFDFRPAGGAPAPRDTVVQANCEPCHGAGPVSPRGAVGVKMCVTCHTWQNADPDTVDPAALDGATAATDPNPLDLGRLVHRIHRGKNLPTLFASSSTAPAPALPSPGPLALPFFPGLNAPVLGRKYAVVGPEGHEAVFGRVVSRIDNAQPARTRAEGVVFPRDLRDCGACHAGAPQEYEVLYAISRRTCAGCHPEIWFGAPNGDGTTSITDVVHFAHPGGPQEDDAECGGCHVVATAAQPKVWAPIAQIHLPPSRSARQNTPVAEIVAVRNLRPGAAPTVVFKITDEVGPVVPSPNAPVPPNDTRAVGTPLPRGYVNAYPTSGAYLAIMINGPTAPDYLGLPSWQVASSAAGNPNIYALVADPATNEYTYTFSSTLPADAAGTWTVVLEGYRRMYARSTLYDPAADAFRWPYTGEPLAEAFSNPIVHVDTATGEWTAARPGTTVPRRTVVTQERCARCHGQLALHGGMRNRVEHCLDCHTATATDWAQRPKANGNVNLSATLDGIEERSVHFKVLIHRIHTGAATGAAALDAIEPHVVYGYGGNPYFFDEGVFPNALANCTLCHEGTTYRIESMPADAAATVANETATIRHGGSAAHVAGEAVTPPVQAACLGCHATGPTRSHVARKTVDGVEQCASCHVRGALSVDVVHGLAAPDRGAVASTWSAIVNDVIVPRCASAACHGGNPPAAFPRLDAEVAYDAMVGVPSQQAGLAMVEPFEPARSYLVLKLRGEAASVGGVATPMPIGDAPLEPSEIAAIEAWIANGAPNE